MLDKTIYQKELQNQVCFQLNPFWWFLFIVIRPEIKFDQSSLKMHTFMKRKVQLGSVQTAQQQQNTRQLMMITAIVLMVLMNQVKNSLINTIYFIYFLILIITNKLIAFSHTYRNVCMSKWQVFLHKFRTYFIIYIVQPRE